MVDRDDVDNGMVCGGCGGLIDYHSAPFGLYSGYCRSCGLPAMAAWCWVERRANEGLEKLKRPKVDGAG